MKHSDQEKHIKRFKRFLELRHAGKVAKELNISHAAMYLSIQETKQLLACYLYVHNREYESPYKHLRHIKLTKQEFLQYKIFWFALIKEFLQWRKKHIKDRK